MTQTGKDYGKELQVIRAMLGLPQAFPSAAVCVPPGCLAAGAAGAVVSHGLYGPRRGYMVTAADIHAIGAVRVTKLGLDRGMIPAYPPSTPLVGRLQTIPVIALYGRQRATFPTWPCFNTINRHRYSSLLLRPPRSH